MLKISRKLSVRLSLVLCGVLMLALLVGVFAMPELAKTLLELAYRSVPVPEGGYAIVLTLAYGILAVCAVADGLLYWLLLRVRDGLVFTGRSISLVRGVSWCAILMGLLFGGLGFYFQLALGVAFAGLFLGLCLRVVKNVLEEAATIKAENDLTV